MNHHRSWGNQARNVKPAATPTNVPSIRMAPLLSDCPFVGRLIIITPYAAQYGFSQSIHKAMPIAIVMARAVLIASLARVERAIMRFR